jgi:hypothetical protein
MVNVNHVGDQKVKQEQNIHHVDLHQLDVKEKAKVKHGAKPNNK